MRILEPRVVEEGVFVFGSNEVGRSFSGAAKTAVEEYGAQMGVSFGLTGQAFAIPTKDANLNPLPLHFIKKYINQFTKIVNVQPFIGLWTDTYMVTRVGCGLAGYTDVDMAQMFVDCRTNCYFDLAWEPYLGEVDLFGDKRMYWGSHAEK